MNWMSRKIRRGAAPAVTMILLAGPMCGAGAAAQAPMPVVEVPGTSMDREEKPYAALLAAMAAFDKNRALAPGAALRFKVLPRKAGVTLDALALHVAGDGGRIAVPLMADQTFVLPGDAAVGANAMVRFNREAGSLAWRADIRSPGLPPNTRRLGDLLLECQVAMAGDLIAYVRHPLNMMVARLPDPCRTVPINLYQFADRPVFGITLVAGTRRSVLPAAMLHGPSVPMLPALQDWTLLRERVYAVKFKALYDKGWPDDTLLQFDYMDDDDAVPLAQELRP